MGTLGVKSAMLCLALTLAACGGNDDDDPVAETPPPDQVAKACTLEAYSQIALQDSEITAVSQVDGGSYQPEGSRQAFDGLPGFCMIQGIARPSSDSLINFEMWIPLEEAWNGKLVATGNGGYSPSLSYGDMAYAMRQGYAVLGGDTGHQTEDMLWGVGHPEKIMDWGSRSVHAITVAAKDILAAAREQPAQRAYYLGCSTGGHQGFAEVQRYPDDFDGIIAGAPGNNRTALNVEFLWRFRANRPQGDNFNQYLTSDQLTFMTQKAVAACDAIDGVEDGVINDPRQCTPAHFDIADLSCSASSAQQCLNDEQLAAARLIYQGPKNPNTGEQLYPGWPVGSEENWRGYLGSTEPVRADFWRYWVFNDPDWNWWDFDFDRDVAYAYQTIAPLVDQTETDLSGFKASEGKLLVYHGWRDAVVSPYDSIKYYEAVRARQGSQQAMDDFYRMFLVPGLSHCQGGTGANILRGDGDRISYAPENDLLSALDRWVEEGRAPDTLTASGMREDQSLFTRTLCAYPKQAVYDGSGNPDEASSYLCQ